jgi:hypothetical protein
MTLVAAWYRSLDGGHVAFCANDSPPNLDYLRDQEAASGAVADSDTAAASPRNPRQEVQHAHLHAFYAEDEETENHESSAVSGHPVLAWGHRAFSDALSGDAVRVDGNDAARRDAAQRAAAQQRAGFRAFAAGLGLSPGSLA